MTNETDNEVCNLTKKLTKRGMEEFLECYLEGFKEAPRNSLHDRRKRKQMVEYISTLVQGCAGATGGDTGTTAEEAVNTIIRHHIKKKNANGTVCMMGKYHNVLYVAMKLCYLWQIQDAELVCQLLKEIYACEKTFERILIGAIFGTKAPHYVAGWKSDFEDQEENVRGVVYFLDKANDGKLELPLSIWGDKPEHLRFIDSPIESCGKAPALRICLQLGLPDKALIFLRFGALTVDGSTEVTCLEQIMNRLMEFNHCYPYNLVACLQLLLRAVPAISTEHLTLDKSHDNYLTRNLIEEKYRDLIENGLVPPSRCGYTPPEMKHLCRCVIRKKLWENFCLPHGIRTLPLPDTLWRYLDILED